MAIEHKHILINAKINDPLETFDDAINFLEELVDKVGMKILMGPHATYVDTPGNRGVTAIVGIETSHMGFHIWDEELDEIKREVASAGKYLKWFEVEIKSADGTVVAIVKKQIYIRKKS